jgi:hypothetical protein
VSGEVVFARVDDAQFLVGARRPARHWPLLAGLAVAVLSQVVVGTSSDTSWLISLCEKILDGKKLYVDFVESNPPAAVFLYMPAVAAARALGVRPEFMVSLFGFLGVVASLALSARILSRAGLARGARSAEYGVAVFAMAVLPSAAFDQREHLALLFGLPLLAALAARASGAKVEPFAAALAGAAAAVTISVKPYFVLAIAPVVLYAFWRAGWRALLGAVEIYVLAAAAAISLILSAALFPAYFDKVLPLVTAIYVPQRRAMAYLVFRPAIVCWVALAGYFWRPFVRRLGNPLVVTPALASAGALTAYFLQGKGWAYHAYPSLALLALTLAAINLSQNGEGSKQRFVRSPLTCAAALLVAFGAFSYDPRPGGARLARLVAATASKPKILMIGGDIALAFPLTRNVGGDWVGTYPFLWVTDTIAYWRATGRVSAGDDARLAAALSDDRAQLAADIGRERPDAILVADEEWRRWAFSQPDIADALAGYAPAGGVGEAIVYGLRDKSSASQ